MENMVNSEFALGACMFCFIYGALVGAYVAGLFRNDRRRSDGKER